MPNITSIALQSQHSTDSFRQILVVPFPEGVRYWSRIKTAGGRENWQEGYPDTGHENLAGLPVVTDWTETDSASFDGYNPTSFGQKASRKLESQTGRGQTKMADLLATINSVAQTAPERLADFAKVSNTPAPAPAPSIQQAVSIEASITPPAPRPTSSVTTPAPARVDFATYVPSTNDPKVASYISRQNLGGLSDVEWADLAVSMGANMAIDGEAGTGKTSFARYYSAIRNRPFVPIICNPQLGLETIEGQILPIEGTGEFAWFDSLLVQAIQQPSVVLLNESSRMKAMQNGYFFSMLEEKYISLTTHRGEIIQKHPECLIITDYNSGYRGVTMQDEAFLDRFAIKVAFDYDTELEASFIQSKSLLELASKIRSQRGDVFVNTPFSTRLLQTFQSVALAKGIEPACYILLQSFGDAIERQALKTLLESYRFNIQDELACN